MNFSLENKEAVQFAISQNGRDLRDGIETPQEAEVPLGLNERDAGSEPGIKLEALAVRFADGAASQFRLL